jgi:hypothetical protein
VGGADLAVLLSLWSVTNAPFGDLNGDGQIGGADLAIFLGNWVPTHPCYIGRSVRVALFTTCLAEALAPRALKAAVLVLEHVGVDGRVPRSRRPAAASRCCRTACRPTPRGSRGAWRRSSRPTTPS